MSIKFRVFGGGFWGGGEVPILFLWGARIFPKNMAAKSSEVKRKRRA